MHINPCDEMWNLIINSLKKNEVTFVVGDFNAYEERGEMKSKPSILRGLGYNSFIPSSVITDYKDNLHLSLSMKTCILHGAVILYQIGSLCCAIGRKSR